MIEPNCNDIIISWTAPPNQAWPITEYSVNVSGVMMSVAADWTNYTHSIHDSVCGETLEIIVSAISAAGRGSATSITITIVCTREGNELTCLIRKNALLITSVGRND